MGLLSLLAKKNLKRKWSDGINKRKLIWMSRVDSLMNFLLIKLVAAFLTGTIIVSGQEYCNSLRKMMGYSVVWFETPFGNPIRF